MTNFCLGGEDLKESLIEKWHELLRMGNTLKKGKKKKKRERGEKREEAKDHIFLEL